MAEHFDIVIIGGGIHGAGVAQAGAARGASVLLLEQHDIASGTSSRSSKLIHGGLRYLETGQFGLVRECLRERETLLRIAPDLVRLVPFYIPVYAQTSRRPWRLRAGLSLYAVLGGLSAHCRFAQVPRARWDELDGLDKHGLQAVFTYFDAQTDDAALTRAVMRSAQSLGAQVHSGAEVTHVNVEDGQSEITWMGSGATQRCTARIVINAAGPWVEHVARRFDPPLTLPDIELVQGTHIVLDKPAPCGCFYVESPADRRALFVLPWRGKTMVGTTETRYHGDPVQVRPQAGEIDYLRRVYTQYFPTSGDAEVSDAFAGLRVLPRASVDAFQRPRDTLLVCDRGSRPRVVTVVGGKLTAYRSTADKVMVRIAGVLPSRSSGQDTRRIVLS